jgi:hypothetical protein
MDGLPKLPGGGSIVSSAGLVIVALGLVGCGGSTPKRTPQSIAEDYIQRNEGYNVECASVGTRVDRHIWRCVGGKRDECWSLRHVGDTVASVGAVNWGRPSGGRDLLEGCPKPTRKREDTTAVTPEPDLTKPHQPATAPNEASTWPPRGYTHIGDNVAFAWIRNNGCGYGTGECWGIHVVTRDGCPNGLYAEANIVNGSEVVDYTNDTLGSLSPGQVAKLDFHTFRENPSLDAELTKLDCY